MSRASFGVFVGLFLCLLPGQGRAESVSYARHIKPFFARYCLECHNADDPKGGLDLSTFKGLQAGGDKGGVLTPKQPDKSKLVLMVEGKAKPKMPPRKARQPKAEEIPLLRAWVASGAIDDSGSATVTLPEIAPKVSLPTPVTALVYRSQLSGKGKEGLLAVAGRGEVLFFDAEGREQGQLQDLHERVTALAFSPDGQTLAVAHSSVGKAHEVQLFHCTEPTANTFQRGKVVNQHTDLIYGLAFSPKGDLLASCGYDRVIRIWEVKGKSPQEQHVLKDHSDAVYSVAFGPNGKYLASGSADRAVKVWEVSTGRRLFTLGESTDWVYAVAWRPSPGTPSGGVGDRPLLLAAGGVDRSIRVWKVTPSGGDITHSVFAHEGAITDLAYSADGKTLFSLGEDRRVKAWDTTRMIERRRGYPRQPEAVLALAVRADGKQLALGRYDGALVLMDDQGKVQSQPLPRKPRVPVLKSITPAWGPRGSTVRLRLVGMDLRDASTITGTIPGLKGKLGPLDAKGQREAQITLPGSVPPGPYTLQVTGPAGKSASVPFTVDYFVSTPESEPNNSPRHGQQVTLSTTVVGAIDRAGDTDYFRFEAKAEQEVGVHVLTTQVKSKLQPVLQLVNPEGQVVAESNEGRLAYRCPQAGKYSLGIRDRDFRGGAGMHYRLSIGAIPVVTGVFPAGVQRGKLAQLRVEGVHLGTDRVVKMIVPTGARVGSKLPVPISTPWGKPVGDASVVVGEFPEVTSEASEARLAVPGTANGRLSQRTPQQTWTFRARKGQKLVLEVHARRLGSPLDSAMEILDSSGNLVEQATLRCLAQTNVTFRDHDSVKPGIRIDVWSELSIDDYLLVGGELVRILALPRNPDDDCRFYSIDGKRRAYLGTTPVFHPNGQPMYKVSIHPPGTTFPPNGLPVVRIYYRNDDGSPLTDKDSRLVFEPPADGEYRVRIRDARGRASLREAGSFYRLTVRPPRPDFSVRFQPTSPALSKGSALPIQVTARRLDEFEGPIQVQFKNLPPGFEAPITTIPAGQESTSFALYANSSAKLPAKMSPLELIARATIAGKEVVRTARGGKLRLQGPGDIVTTTERSEISVQPGSKVRLTVHVKRQNKFKGRIPLDVRGLPHGVRVLNVGLNGILITPKETSRTIVLYAEPWVEPTNHPIVILARREGKNTEHAAPSVMLRVVNKSERGVVGPR